MELDHLAVAGLTLAEAATQVETALGVMLQQGGEHDIFHTHNKLLGLDDGLYLEAISVNAAAPVPERPRWFDLDNFSGPPRLTNWICRCDDLDATLADLPETFGAPVSLQRGDLRWRMAVPALGRLPFDNCAPALIEWQGDMHPAMMLETSQCALIDLQVSHPEVNALRDLLAPFLTDTRVGFVTGPRALRARFTTPSGERMLT